MKHWTERNLSSNCLVVECMAEVSDDFRVKMTEHNRIHGLLQPVFKETDGIKRLYYDISSRKKLSAYFSDTPVSAVNIRSFIYAVRKLLDVIPGYLICPSDIVLDPEYIFVDEETMEPAFCILPGYMGDFPGDFRKLLKQIMEAVDMSDMSAVLLAYSVYHASAKENYVIGDIMAAASEAERQREKVPCKQGETENDIEKSTETGTWEAEEDEEYQEIAVRPLRLPALSCDGSLRGEKEQKKKSRKRLLFFQQS